MPRLVTITFSHYCEKARWALDRGHVPYLEEGHLPLFAWLPALRAGKKRTVPSLATGEGAVADSTDILRWVDRHGDAPPLFPADVPEAAELEERFDLHLGPHTRRIAYHHVLPVVREQIAGLRGVPRAEVATTRLLARPIGALMRRGLRIDDAGVARSHARVDEVLAEVERRLGDGRRYLAGNRFTAADLTFAALMTPLVAPPQLADFLPLAGDGAPAGLAALIDAIRSRPAGRFVLRLYAEERGHAGQTAAATSSRPSASGRPPAPTA